MNGFYRNGWTIGLARDSREILAPTITKTVALAWLLAIESTQ